MPEWLAEYLKDLPWVQTVLTWGFIPYVLALAILVMVFYYIGKVGYRLYVAVRSGFFPKIKGIGGSKSQGMKSRLSLWKLFPARLYWTDVDGVSSFFKSGTDPIGSFLGNNSEMLEGWAKDNPLQFMEIVRENPERFHTYCSKCGNRASVKPSIDIEWRVEDT